MKLKLKELYINKFRNFKNVEIKISDYITVISGHNGSGKSNILSLIASGSGVNKKGNLDSNFQPEFYDFFNIDEEEDYKGYDIVAVYRDVENDSVYKKLTFKNDSRSGRGIRVIPRTRNIVKPSDSKKNSVSVKEETNRVKEKFGIGEAARVPIPTIYLSVSRLYPLGECKSAMRVKNLQANNKLYEKKADEKFREWYNKLIPNSIRENAGMSLVDKKISSRKSLYLEMENIPIKSQSIGQDNLGNIVSALVDIYLLSLEDDYEGAILCIDEIEVSLHPDVQINLLQLLEKCSEELKIQVVLTTHSLTILKYACKKREKYTVQYFKNPKAPYVTCVDDYFMIKADLLNQLVYKMPEQKIFFEDNMGRNIFELLLNSIIELYRDESREEKFDQRINEEIDKKFKFIQTHIVNKCIKKETGLGCENLILMNNIDEFFKSVIFVLDGDVKGKNYKPKLKDYLDDSKRSIVEETIKSHCGRQLKENICCLPKNFPPESYLYLIIRELIRDGGYQHMDFWRSVDMKEEISLFTPSKLEEIFDKNKHDYENDKLKKIFKKQNILMFIKKSNLVPYYYSKKENVEELIRFMDDFVKSYNMAHSIGMQRYNYYIE